MNQHEWVYGCYQYYLENHIEPGNPEDGVWEQAHWPVPKCKGGSKTILLLKQHHAVHGVLQSEEWQWPCIYGWEKNYLDGELLQLFSKWYAQRGVIGGSRSRQNLKDKGVLEEHTSRAGKIGAQVTNARGHGFFGENSTVNWIEVASKAGSKGCQVTNSQRWRCKETGHMSTAAGVVRYQILRGIDSSKSNRERIG